jgi:hypothetical protein
MITVMIIGERGNLSRRLARRRARLAAKAIKRMPPHDVVDPSIFGYDADSRELWDIPEARDYFITFIDETTAQGIPLDRWLPQTHELLAVCRATQAGHRVGVKGTVADTMRDGIDQIVRYHRSHLH